MFRAIGRVVWVSVLLVAALARAEDVKDLPKPTSSYVSDFAGVLDADAKAQMEQLCSEVYHQANATIAVVTVHNLGDASIEDFATDLEQKWGVGKKGTDRGVLMLFAMDEHKDRIEVGYGLEGLLNDAKVGDILRSQRPVMKQGQYSQAIQNDLQQVANDIAADAGVTLNAPQHQYHRERERQGNPGGTFLKIFFLILVLWLIFRRRGGRGGYGGGGGGFWPGLLIGNMLGGSRGGGWGGGNSGGGWGSSGGGGSSDDGGGFGGFDGGSSGGGGASGDW